jgi:hypothetical protein
MNSMDPETLESPLARRLRLVLILAGLALLALAAAYLFHLPFARALWPWAGDASLAPISYIFLAAILSGFAAPLLWYGVSRDPGGVRGYGLYAVALFGSVGIVTLLGALAGAPGSLLFATIVFLLLALASAGL